ncbi:hypothetical protein FD41_GL001723 [Lentilactobacillus farraginis DSM 18382 = JCM 14108]|uniref:Uncharacterized protein n=1 Tax=Lentilactobacillus farraginis DSM 18382 = JCM 14108 TaxID=1423743 RepID=X0P9Q2_9LACO|nr:hypothetical protein FD41_GL001723 [Lentilactobacillus farraginis DSM 18382 = JCM 14108]GAF35653.1 hypothetical protein JCM14108_551 [Lentilactobacillus farraginis DSM 18382 = JCM 14108]
MIALWQISLKISNGFKNAFEPLLMFNHFVQNGIFNKKAVQNYFCASLLSVEN